jgi:hypothetical protein
MPFHAPLYLSMPRVEMVFNQVLGSVAEDVGRVFGHRGEASLLVRANRTRIHPFAAAAERPTLSGGGRTTCDRQLGARAATHRGPPVRWSALLARLRD